MCTAPAGPAPPASLTVLASAALWLQEALLCAPASSGAVTWLARVEALLFQRGLGAGGLTCVRFPWVQSESGCSDWGLAVALTFLRM